MILIRLLSKLPLWVLFILSDVIYLLAYYLISYRKNIVRSNLKQAFPEKSSKQIRKIEKQFYRNFTDSLAETIKLLTIGKKELDKRFLAKNSSLIFDKVDQGETIIGMCGHLFNWEGHLLSVSSVVQEKCETIYTKVNQPFFENLMHKIRGRMGADLTERKSFQRAFLRKRNIPRLIVLAADQRPNMADIRYRRPFLNRETTFFEGGEKLSKKFNLTVIYAYITKPKRGYYEYEYRILAQPPYDNDQPHSITDTFVKLLEENIRDQPALYLWSHNRWKEKFPQKTAGLTPPENSQLR